MTHEEKTAIRAKIGDALNAASLAETRARQAANHIRSNQLDTAIEDATVASEQAAAAQSALHDLLMLITKQ